MDKLYEKLDTALCEEVERQENILAVCVAQGEAARKRDIDTLEAKTAALILLLREESQAEATRNQIVEKIARQNGLPSRPTLHWIADTAPSPWRERLLFYHKQLRDVLNRSQPVVRDNAVLMRTALKIVGSALQTLGNAIATAPGGYTAIGAEDRLQEIDPRLIDQKG